MTIFARSRAGLYLPPGVRTVLKAIETCIAAGVVAAIPVAVSALTGGAVNWNVEIPVIVSAFAVAFLLTAYKFLQAVGGSPSSPQGFVVPRRPSAPPPAQQAAPTPPAPPAAA